MFKWFNSTKTVTGVTSRIRQRVKSRAQSSISHQRHTATLKSSPHFTLRKQKPLLPWQQSRQTAGSRLSSSTTANTHPRTMKPTLWKYGKPTYPTPMLLAADAASAACTRFAPLPMILSMMLLLEIAHPKRH